MSIGRRSSFAAALAVGLLLLFQAAAPPGAGAETLRWRRTYRGPANGPDWARGVAVAPDGSVYVVGRETTGLRGVLTDEDLALRKYNSQGDLVWMRTHPGSGYGVAVAGDGSVYVTGAIVAVYAQMADVLLVKYSSEGEELWTRTYSNDLWLYPDMGFGVAAGPDGSVYVTGYTSCGSPYEAGGGQGDNLLLIKYSREGAMLWMRTYNSPSNYDDGGTDVAVARDGSVYVAGFTNAKDHGHVLLRKYSSAGAVLWTRTGSGIGGYGVAVAPGGSVYVAGTTSTGTGNGYSVLLRKYSRRGALLWTRTYKNPVHITAFGADVAVAADGSVFVTGTTFVSARGEKGWVLLRKYSAQGAALWTKTYHDPAMVGQYGAGVAVAADGSIYAAGSIKNPGDTFQSFDWLLLKYK